MKTKNIVYIAKSIDGYIAGPNGELDWLQTVPNPTNDDMGFYEFMEPIDALIMGRNTYEMVASFEGPWPYSKHVFVLSNSLKKIPENLSDKVSLVSGTITEVLKNIHNKGFYKLYIDGGKTIQSFLKHDLIDELIISTIPIVLGKGIPLFDIVESKIQFSHHTTKVLLGEIVQSHYIKK
ncbi:dihydrofolate reductase family protein [Flavicella marina]|uniref:dihydrofolate reductase family protein n=1 Tax=Flavicella marina TaxID=1475951 RepID=UPI001264E011|nr:dihydrofolate reductase family protein [Flavicella marina]